MIELASEISKSPSKSRTQSGEQSTQVFVLF